MRRYSSSTWRRGGDQVGVLELLHLDEPESSWLALLSSSAPGSGAPVRCSVPVISSPKSAE
jgi:hypothetical protein